MEICPQCHELGSGAYEEARVYYGKKVGKKYYVYARFVHPFRVGKKVSSKTCRLTKEQTERLGSEGRIKSRIFAWKMDGSMERWTEIFLLGGRGEYHRGTCPHCREQARLLQLRKGHGTWFECSKCGHRSVIDNKWVFQK